MILFVALEAVTALAEDCAYLELATAAPNSPVPAVKMSSVSTTAAAEDGATRPRNCVNAI